MKKKCLFLLLIVGVTTTFAQNTGVILKSPPETFADKKGTVIEKRFDEVGKVGFLNIQLEYITDLNTNDKMQCIRFDIQLANNSAGPSALLDTNEVNGLLNFLKYITTKVTIKPPVDPNTEISYTDNYNLEIGCFWQKASGWIVYIRTDANTPSTETDIYQADIAGFTRILALAKLDLQKN